MKKNEKIFKNFEVTRMRCSESKLKILDFSCFQTFQTGKTDEWKFWSEHPYYHFKSRESILNNKCTFRNLARGPRATSTSGVAGELPE